MMFLVEADECLGGILLADAAFALQLTDDDAGSPGFAQFDAGKSLPHGLIQYVDGHCAGVVIRSAEMDNKDGGFIARAEISEQVGLHKVLSRMRKNIRAQQ